MSILISLNDCVQDTLELTTVTDLIAHFLFKILYYLNYPPFLHRIVFQTIKVTGALKINFTNHKWTDSLL